MSEIKMLTTGDRVYIKKHVVSGKPGGTGVVRRLANPDNPVFAGHVLVTLDDGGLGWFHPNWLMALKPKPVSHE